MNNKVFVKTDDGWFDYWACKRCGHRQQLTIDKKPLPDVCPKCGHGKNIKEENEIMANKFTCPICGKSYETTSELAKCVIACDKMVRERDERAKSEAKNAAAQKIMDAYDNIKVMIEEFNSLYPNDKFSFTLSRGSVSAKGTGDKNLVRNTAKPELDLESIFKTPSDKSGDKPILTKESVRTDLFTLLDELFKTH